MTLTVPLADVFITSGLAIAGAAAVSIPIAIHLLTRLRRQQQPWAAMRFLIEAFRRQRQRLRIEQLLLLLVRCLIVAILGLALAGPHFAGIWRAFGGDTSGRLVCLVIDDALSSQATSGGDQHTRLDGLTATAGRILDALAPGDRVALWAAARPVNALIAPPTGDLAQVRRTLAALHGRASHSDWPSALAAVDAALAEQGLERDRATVYLLGDFSAGSVQIDRPLPSALSSLGAHARIVAAHPAPSAPNFQIASLTPFRSMILPQEGATTTVPVEVRLRRFATDAAGATTGVQVDLLGAASGPEGSGAASSAGSPVLATARQEVRWAAGQTAAVVHLDLPVTPDMLSPGAGGTPATTSPTAAATSPGGAAPENPSSLNKSSGSGQALTLRATLQAAGDDALPLDNQRFALVELRHRLEVGLIDDASTPASPGSLRPRDWLSIVLEPQSTDPARSINLVNLAPAMIDTAALSRLDAVMVLRPDLLGAPGSPAWAALKTFAQRGGLVWIFTPPTDAPALWANAFHDQFGLDWQVGLAPHTAPGVPGTPAATDVPATDPRPPRPKPQAPSDPGWKLATDIPTPEPLRLLSTDWSALLRPITVLRRIDLTSRGGQESAWLRVAPLATPATASATSAGAGADHGATLMAAAPVGPAGGYVIFLATALDPAWSNLTTKPLFLPLIHETLRGVLGSSTEAARLNAVVSGEQPPLGPRWEGTQELLRVGARQSVAVRRTDKGLEPAVPLEAPGIYRARPGAGLRLAVNPDADAGNTTALESAALGQWLSPLGETTWLDEEAPAAVLLAEKPATNLGWPLLCMVLALVLFETWLARAFSHAVVPPTAPPKGGEEHLGADAATDVPGKPAGSPEEAAA